MNINFSKTKLSTAVVMSLVTFIMNAPAQSQTFRINNQGRIGYGFTTNVGTISALHVGGLGHDYYCSELDIAINTRNRSEGGYTTSDLPPSYFIDRRGTKHLLEATSESNHQTIVSMRFFFGESGMPIFAEDGSVCCVVLGNAFIRGRWRGRVARITPLTSFVKEANSQQTKDAP